MQKLIIAILVIAIIIAGFIYHPVVGILIFVAMLAVSFYLGRGMFYVSLSKAEAGKGNEARASQWLDKAYKTAPNNAGIAIAYSYDLLRNDETERADEVLAAISTTELSKEQTISYDLNRSIVLWRQDETKKSISIVEQLYAQYKNTVIYGTLGYYYILDEQWDRALSLNEEAYEFNDSNNAIIDNLALTYYYLERYDEAFVLSEKLVAGEPTFREAYYNAGVLYEMREQWHDAYKYYKLSLDFKPALVSHVTVQEIEAKLAYLEENYGEIINKVGEGDEQSEVDS